MAIGDQTPRQNRQKATGERVESQRYKNKNMKNVFHSSYLPAVVPVFLVLSAEKSRCKLRPSEEQVKDFGEITENYKTRRDKTKGPCVCDVRET